MKLKPETIMILQAAYILVPAVHEVTNYKVKKEEMIPRPAGLLLL